METQGDQKVAFRPKLESDAPGRNRDVIPYYDTVRRFWQQHELAKGAKPIAGALIVGGTCVVLAIELGVGEFLLGAGAAYATYRMLRYGIGLKQALTETVQLEKVVIGEVSG